MGEPISDSELGRRLSAGRGYLRESGEEFAKRLKVDRHDLRLWEHGEFGSEKRFRLRASKREKAVRLVQEATGLPHEFFSVDFSQLPAMVQAWRRLEGGDQPEPGSPAWPQPPDDSGEPGGELRIRPPDLDDDQAQSEQS